MDIRTAKPANTVLITGCKEILDEPLSLGLKVAVTPIAKMELNEGKADEADDLSRVNLNVPVDNTIGDLLDLADLPSQLANPLSGNIQNLENKSTFASFGRSQDGRREPKELKEGILPRTGEPKKRRLEDSVEHKNSMEIAHGSKCSSESGNSQSQSLSKLVTIELNSAVGIVKDSVTPSSPLIPKLTISGVNLSTSISKSSTGKATQTTKQTRVKVNSSIAPKEENAPIPVKDMEEVSENPTKGQSKVSIFSGSNLPQCSKTSYSSSSEHIVSDSKEESPFRSSKVYSKHTAMGNLRSDNVVGSRHSQLASGQSKPVSSNLSQRMEKSHQTSPYTLAKTSNTSMFMHASVSSNATSTLSDEEVM